MKQVPVATKTILSEVEPMLDNEKRAMADKWAERTLVALLAYADADLSGSFAKRLCQEVADKFGADDKLSALLLKRIKAVRINLPRGRHKTWTPARYYELLVHYHLFMLDTSRADALEKLANKFTIGGENRTQKIEERITQARKEVNRNDLPDFCRYPPE